MLVSLLSGLPAMPSDSRESNDRVAALVLHHCCVGVVCAVLLRKRRNTQHLSGASFLLRFFNVGIGGTDLPARSASSCAFALATVALSSNTSTSREGDVCAL